MRRHPAACSASTKLMFKASQPALQPHQNGIFRGLTTSAGLFGLPLRVAEDWRHLAAQTKDKCVAVLHGLSDGSFESFTVITRGPVSCESRCQAIAAQKMSLLPHSCLTLVEDVASAASGLDAIRKTDELSDTVRPLSLALNRRWHAVPALALQRNADVHFS